MNKKTIGYIILILLALTILTGYYILGGLLAVGIFAGIIGMVALFVFALKLIYG